MCVRGPGRLGGLNAGHEIVENRLRDIVAESQRLPFSDKFRTKNIFILWRIGDTGVEILDKVFSIVVVLVGIVRCFGS